jgi:hypothetical protein
MIKIISIFVLSIIYVAAHGGSYNSGYEGICFRRTSTGDRLLITEDRLYFTNPSDPFACQVWEYARQPPLGKRGIETYHGLFQHIVITDSKCFIPGPKLCRRPARFFIKTTDFGEAYQASRSANDAIDCVNPYGPIVIGTTEDTCCTRVAALIGEWVPSDDCSKVCDCSADCEDVAPCLTRTTKDKELRLSFDFVNQFFNVSSPNTTAVCNKYPFDGPKYDGSLLVSDDFCGTPCNISCSDPQGQYYCSVRLNTVTFYYREDECTSRTNLLGATWLVASNTTICNGNCTCTTCLS